MKISVRLSEYSFHAHELDSTERFVNIPLLYEDKAKYSCGVRPACPIEFFPQLESPVVKFSVGLSEHSFHAQKLDSTKKSVPIPLLNQDKAKYSCGVRPACPTENLTPCGSSGIIFLYLVSQSTHSMPKNLIPPRNLSPFHF